MEQEVVLLDTSVLIDYFRKKDKTKSVLFRLTMLNKLFAVSAITQFEIYAGAHAGQVSFWDSFFHEVLILPFNSEISILAANINSDLKRKRRQIDIPDLFIAATAIINELPCVTLNKKHFERIENLKLFEI